MPLIIPANTLSTGGYTVANSCRFNSADGAYMYKTQSAGNRKTWTFATWIKRGILGANQNWGATQANTTNNNIMPWTFNTSDKINIYDYNSAISGQLITTQVFRDPSAWFHFVLAVDTEQAVAANRMKMYINGTQVTAFDTETQPAEDYEFNINVNTKRFTFGIYDYGILGSPADQYYAETIFIDGTQYAASDFGEFDSDSPTIWKPKDPSELTFGTNGFWLDYEDSSNLGNDANGGTDLTSVNLDATDQATDTPTNNFATLNPLINKSSGAPTIAEGNLLLTTNSEEFGSVSSIGVSSGKWYCETKFVSGSYGHFGITGAPILLTTLAGAYAGATDYGWGWNYGGSILKNDSAIDTYNTFATGDIIGIGLDLDNNKLYLAKNGTWEESGDPTSGATGTGALSITDPASVPEGAYFIFVGNGSSAANATVAANFGGCPPFAISSGNADADGYGNFEYAVPSGYYALCTKNLAEYG